MGETGDPEKSAQFTVTREDCGGTKKHPRGYYDAVIQHVSEPDMGPYGYWFRLQYQTVIGTVYGVLTPHFGPMTDLGLLYLATVEGALPEKAGVGFLVGKKVEIEVIWQREHGALCDIAVPRHRQETLEKEQHHVRIEEANRHRDHAGHAGRGDEAANTGRAGQHHASDHGAGAAAGADRGIGDGGLGMRQVLADGRVRPILGWPPPL